MVLNQSVEKKIGINSDASLTAVTLPNNNRIYPDGKKMWFQFNDGNDNFGWISMDGMIANINSSITKLQNYDERLVDNTKVRSDDVMMSRSNTLGYRKNNSYYFNQTGIYGTSTDTTGATDYGLIATFKAPNADWIWQMWFTTSNHLYVRQNINSGGYTAWKTIY